MTATDADRAKAADAIERGQGICRTCLAVIWNEGGMVHGEARPEGWSDRIMHGGDSLVCFKAVDYRHVPLTGREAAIYDRAYARGAERAAAVADLRARVEAVAEEWDADHADWCCQRGCPNFDGLHPGAVEFTTEGGIRQIGPDFPCPGECTCYVGPFRDRLRAAVTDTTGGTR